MSDNALSDAHRAATSAARELYDGQEGALFALMFGEQMEEREGERIGEIKQTTTAQIPSNLLRFRFAPLFPLSSHLARPLSTPTDAAEGAKV